MDGFMAKVHQAPDFRWGSFATTITATLTALLLLSLYSPVLAKGVILIIFEVLGALGLLVYLISESFYIRSKILKILLSWRKWAYIPRSPIAAMYLAVVGALGGAKPKLWSLQHCLPSLPVPDLQHTLSAYLDSVQALLGPEEFAATQKYVREFGKAGGVGEKLQEMLVERSRKEETSWLLEWWESIIYLKSRNPIAIYSNWYGLDKIDPCVRNQTTRAANLISAVLKFKHLIDTQQLEPNRVQGTVPLCMWQYSRLFGTVRIPGPEIDELITHKNSKHIVVEYRNLYFKVDLYYEDGSPLKNEELQEIFSAILEKFAQQNPSETPNYAILTAENRSVWSEARSQLIEMDPINRKTLHTIESSLFVIHFDDGSPETVEELAYEGLHRHGKPIWFDKNFNLIFFANGRLASNVDHTWADASTMVHVFDYVFAVEKSADHWVKKKNLAKVRIPEALRFQVTPQILKSIADAQARFQPLASNIELHVLKFQQYGKGLIKKLGVSPDAYCQAAIQLAFYKIHNSFALTYESAATVRFHHGRTETVSSLSMEMKTFCEHIHDKTKTPAEQLESLKNCCKVHVKAMRIATNGDGFVRHLFGLRILAAASGLPLPPIFTDKAYNFEYKLSTSQTPAAGMLGGGFSPISHDGYGVAYVVAEDRLWFHISAYRSSAVTDPKKFEYALQEALLDMYDMCLANEQYAKVFSQRTYRIQRME